MTHTGRHLLVGTTWFFTPPWVSITVVVAFGLTVPTPVSFLVSLVWTLGLIAVFWSWAAVDAPVHGKPVTLAAWFSAAWLVLLFLAVVPYLLVTRGLRRGSLAAAKFLVLCFVYAGIWIGLPPIVMRILS